MAAFTAVALTTLAIVAQDATTLRAAPSASAATQAQLWQGELLEVRGSRLDYLQVYDHRRERAGYVRASQVRVLPRERSRGAAAAGGAALPARHARAPRRSALPTRRPT